MKYKEVLSCDGKDEEIDFEIEFQVPERLAQLIERSAVREFFGVYDEASETITIKGETAHTVI